MRVPHPKRPSVLPPEGLRGLLAEKQAYRQATPEHLVQAAVQVVMQLTRKEPAAAVLSPQVLELVGRTLGKLRRGAWKPDTALILRKRPHDDKGA